MTVSIIVPVYNTSRYLDRCLKSLVGQTIKDIEIILVDDGSTDGSSVLCDNYAKMDNRIKVVHKENGGLSSARNAGIDIASGKYIGFVDSDDDVESDMYELMKEVIETENVDFVMCDYKRVLKDQHSYIKTLNINKGKYDKKAIINEIYPSLIMGHDINYGPLLSVWHCLYRKTFINDNQLRFDEEVKWSEDNIFSAIAGYNADSFYYLKKKALYHYYQNEGTITTSYRKGAWDVYKTMNRHLKEYFSDKEGYDFTQQLKWHLLYYACNCIGQTGSLSNRDRKRVIKEILDSDELKNAFEAVDLRSVSPKLRLQLFFMKHHCVNILNMLIIRRNQNA